MKRNPFFLLFFSLARTLPLSVNCTGKGNAKPMNVDDLPTNAELNNIRL